MHLPDGLLSPGLSISGYAFSLGIVLGIFLRGRKKALLGKMTQVSMVSAAVFISSLIHIPMGFTSVHFTFAPLAGILLGPHSFIAVAMAIFLQWLLLGHGGFTTLGVNAFNMGLSALAAWFLFHRINRILPEGKKYTISLAVFSGIAATALKVVLGSSFLILSGFPTETFYLLLFAHIPVILGEGAIAGLAANYVLKLFREGEIGLHAMDKRERLHTSTTTN